VRDWPYTWPAMLGGPAIALALGIAISRRSPVECSRKFYPARLVGGARKADRIKWIVVHSSESTSGAANVASWFQSPDSGGSTQVVVGEDGCFRCVDDLRIAAGAPPLNEEGLHIEFVGLAKWTRREWLARQRTLALGTGVLARWSREFGVPLAHVGVKGLLSGVPGVVTHEDVSIAFKQSDHVDPGKNFPLEELLGVARLIV